MKKSVLQQIQHNPEQSRRIGLVVDEGADLTQEIIEKYQIATVPIKADWPPEVENLPGETIFHKMREADKRGLKVFCKTSQPSPKDFLDPFKKELEKYEKIICITITSKLSGTYNSAIQARSLLTPEQQKRVFVVDSLNAICADGLFVLKAVDLIKEGKEAERIVQELNEFTQKVHLIAILKDPKWLEASGRISSTLANWIRKVAKIGIRPIIGIKKGVVKAKGIKTGVKDVPTAIYQELESQTRKSRKAGKKIRVAIMHCLDIKGAQKIKEMIEKELPDIEIAFLSSIDTVIGSIVGPGSLGLAWCEI
jgi:DegV family protein with EDD domain